MEMIIFWWSGTLSPMDYVLPIMDVTHCRSIKELTFPRVSDYDPKYDALIPLLTKLPKIDEVIVENTTSWCFSPRSPLLKVLRIIFPVTSAVTITDQVGKPKYLREVFKGNFDTVSVSLPWEINGFSLNDWRIANAKTLKLDLRMTNYWSLMRMANVKSLGGSDFKVEDVNRYFKLWMKKKCNPRLENLIVRTRENVTKDLLLKGLNAVQVPIRTDVKLLRSDEEITFEFDVTRADGRRATIRISNLQIVYFYVWPICQNRSSFIRTFSFISTFYNSCIEHFK